MRVSFDNNWLFTAGKDGTLLISEIKEKDTRGKTSKRDKEIGGITLFSDEILTEKQEIEEDR